MKRTGLLLCLMWAVACGGAIRGRGDGGDGDLDGGAGGGGGGGGGNPDLSACRDVCWAPKPRPATPTTQPGQPMNVVITDCNVSGLTPNSCPAGFTCTGTQTTPLGTGATYTRATCEPTQRPAGTLIFELPDDPPVAKVAVQLTFTLNGAAWPRSPTAGAAGTLTLTRHGGGRPVSVEMPTSSDTLSLTLAPGEYDGVISFAGTSFDSTRYPSLTLLGLLAVVQAGQATIDLGGTPVDYRLLLDGAAFPSPAASESIQLSFTGGHGQYAYIIKSGGTGAGAPIGPIVLEPDTYRVSLTTRSYADAPSFPSGDVELAPSLVVGTTPLSPRFDVRTVAVSGAITVDGADLPAGVPAKVGFGASTIKVPTTRPARYSGRIFPGTHEVTLDTTGASNAAIPSSTVIVRPSFTVTTGPTTLDLAATSTTFSGTLTLNNAVVPGTGYRGSILVRPAGKANSQFLTLASSGAATWSARVYSGSYDVSVYGSGPLPNYDIPLQAGLAITTPRTATYNVNAATATITLLDGNSQPADATVTRGSFAFKRVGSTAAFPINPSATPPNTGPLRVAVPLETGTWSVEFRTGSTYSGLPLGAVTLPDLQVNAGGATVTHSLRGVTVAGELRRMGGAALPAATAGMTRGAVMLTTLGARQDLPSTGAAAFSFRVFPGVLDLALDCSMNCDVVPTTFQWLATGIDFPAP